MLEAMRRASSRVSNFAADRPRNRRKRVAGRCGRVRQSRRPVFHRATGSRLPRVWWVTFSKLSNGLVRPKRDGRHGGPSRFVQPSGQGCIGGLDEEEALARSHLGRAGWWHRGRDHLSSRLRADFRISPLIFCVQFSAVDHAARRPGSFS
jgi:hypothetical protein